jgi:hypothetical protein
MNERPCESLEYFIRPQPDVFVAAETDIGSETFTFVPYPAANAVAGDNEVGFR